MEEEMKTTQPETPAQAPMDIAKIIEELRAKGLQDEEILAALGKMVEEGSLSPEEFEKAKQMLEQKDKEEASKMFGVDIL